MQTLEQRTQQFLVNLYSGEVSVIDSVIEHSTMTEGEHELLKRSLPRTFHACAAKDADAALLLLAFMLKIKLYDTSQAIAGFVEILGIISTVQEGQTMACEIFGERLPTPILFGLSQMASATEESALAIVAHDIDNADVWHEFMQNVAQYGDHWKVFKAFEARGMTQRKHMRPYMRACLEVAQSKPDNFKCIAGAAIGVGDKDIVKKLMDEWSKIPKAAQQRQRLQRYLNGEIP